VANTLFILSLVIIWIMLLYHMFLMLGGFFHYMSFERVIPKWQQSMKRLPTVTVLIPAHNEAVVIRRTLQSMVRLNYPKDLLQIIVINDNSTDKTGKIAREFAEKHMFIQVVDTKPPQAGKGKSSALNFALDYVEGEYIVVYDADNTPERDSVYHLVLCLENDPKAGAAVGKFRVSNAQKNLLTRFINIETIGFQWMAQAGRWFWFKMATIPGTNFAIRRSIIETLGGWDEQALAEDTELSIRVYNLGYYIRFFPAAVTWEQEPETWPIWWRQRIRWARGNQYVVAKFMLNFLKLERKAILFDLIYFFFTYFLFFMGVILSNIIFVTNLFIDLQLSVGFVTIILWIFAYLLYVTQVYMTLSIEKTEMTLTNFFIVLFMYFTYSQLWILLVVRATYVELRRLMTGEEVKWYKTERFDE